MNWETERENSSPSTIAQSPWLGVVSKKDESEFGGLDNGKVEINKRGEEG